MDRRAVAVAAICIIPLLAVSCERETATSDIAVTDTASTINEAMTAQVTCASTNTKPVTIRLKKNNDKVDSVWPDPIKVAVGDCVKWVIEKENGDTSAANIELIDFINTPADAQAEGKPQDPFDIGDHCQGEDLDCTVPVVWRNGKLVKYKYVVKVKHDNKNKKSKDPEMEVSCSGCGGGSGLPGTGTDTSGTGSDTSGSAP
ncbi:MAG TPA: hypothetical protein VF057_06335 [Thermoanaerobaculia bacterium]